MLHSEIITRLQEEVELLTKERDELAKQLDEKIDYISHLENNIKETNKRIEHANKYSTETIKELNEKINDKNEIIKTIIESIPVNRLVILKKLSDWDFIDYLIYPNDITLDDLLNIMNNYNCRIGVDYDLEYRNHLCITVLDDYIDYY